MSNYKNQDVDYIKGMNKIVILSLAGIAALGTSMLVIESQRSTTSSNNQNNSEKISMSCDNEKSKFLKIKLPSSNVNLNSH